ncbi:unnamed protein product [Kuraishia capsulata CBS 1993]|uniref:Thioesterase domain-containing protein n=1 Tax=Kuraishia capsulata CBS 1993 TaxID=1382522 RepID=W6MXQ3_9ASCO|nr:uncharacterized protein KUCA_T00005278001 [Kuraishia capsulata CBS 1993]CDK29290.1 unnamed protein product [Kuraishia capsulata CBS 1993]
MFNIGKRAFVGFAAIGAGYASFVRAWPDDSKILFKAYTPDPLSVKQIQNNKLFQQYQKDTPAKYKFYNLSGVIPKAHHGDHVGTGLLYDSQHLEIDPAVFVDRKSGDLTAFYHLGEKLVGSDGKIHNGLISTLMDEALCFCGFPLLPSKRGVTAKLSVDFVNKAPPNSTVILKAHVFSVKGRKCVIHGTVETVPVGKEPAILVSKAECILVEPKWFKFLSWVPAFDT